VTTLTTKTAYRRHTTHSPSASSTFGVDPQSPLLNSALTQLIASHQADTHIIVHLAPALQYRVVNPLSIASPVEPIDEQFSPTASSFAVIDRFMSRWSGLAGDPILSKWIVIALGLSVFLNAYLLKGIASGSDSGFAPGSAAEAAARILLASTGVTEMDDNGRMRATRRWSGGIEDMQDLQKDWTKEDAAAMTQHHRHKLENAEAASKEPVPSVIKVTSTADDSDDSDPADMIIVRTKARKATITPGSHAANVLATKAAAVELQAPSLSVEAERAIRLSPSTVALVPLAIPDTPRSLDICVKIFDNGTGAMLLNDEEIIMLVQKGKVAAYALEKLLNDYERSVAIRRALICE
jgi:hydroxymethylglutaryl-CoA reductase (NADPH)